MDTHMVTAHSGPSSLVVCSVERNDISTSLGLQSHAIFDDHGSERKCYSKTKEM